MNRCVAVAALLALFAGAAARADITIRRNVGVTAGAGLPAEMQAPLKEQIASATPPENVTRIKGDKSYSSFGQLIGITDSSRNQITLLNPKTKQYATGPLADYLEKVIAATQAATQNFAAPQAQQILQNMKFDVQSRKTGQTATIQGILAEESVITLSMGMPVGQTMMPAMRMEMDCWIAQPAEMSRIPGLKELADYTARNKSAFDPTEALTKMFAQMPGLGEQLREPLKLINTAGTLMLKMRASIFIPAMAQAMPQIDPSKPMAQVESNVTELSTAPIPDSLFSIPADYQPAPMEDLIKLALPAAAQPPPR